MDKVYREELMEHFKNPQNYGNLPDATNTIVEKNPMCGDILTLKAVITDNKLADIKFTAEACAVCIAGASVLTDEVKSKSLDDALTFTKDQLLEELGGNLTTSRIKCATLSLEALKNLIAQNKNG